MWKGKDSSYCEYVGLCSKHISVQQLGVIIPAPWRVSQWDGCAQISPDWEISKETQLAAWPKGCFRWDEASKKIKQAILDDATVWKLSVWCKGTKILFILLIGQTEVQNHSELWALSFTPRAVCKSLEGSWKLLPLIIHHQKVLYTS